MAKMPSNWFGKVVYEILYLGRRVLIKWWDKLEFFKEDSVFTQKGLVSFKLPLVPKPPKKDVYDILKELLSSSSKSELKKQLREILSESGEDK